MPYLRTAMGDPSFEHLFLSVDNLEEKRIPVKRLRIVNMPIMPFSEEEC